MGCSRRLRNLGRLGAVAAVFPVMFRTGDGWTPGFMIGACRRHHRVRRCGLHSTWRRILCGQAERRQEQCGKKDQAGKLKAKEFRHEI
ncbi:hypothetical protein SAMN06269301_1679 [Geobacter sp. DSM 9736]|nr:hypothetical protein SAMN06269301_1679 [Geobacter sp. DSM 9736]